MITIYGDREPEQQTHSQLHPHAQLVNKEPDRKAKRPWFKRPSIAWILCMKTLSSLSTGIAAGPRVEIFTEIICRGYNHHSKRFGVCTGNPQVQAEVARFNAIFAVIAGVLSLCTAGWWGGLTDRYGRTRVLGMVVFAPLISDFITMLVFFFPDKFPGGYWFLVTAPIVEGILGSPSSTAAAETTYMRDVSEPHNLSRNFAFLVGIFHSGGSIGPIIGGFLNEKTGSTITALYATTILHLVYAFIAWFALPESVSKASMIHARNQFAHELSSVVTADAGPFRRRLIVFAKAFWDSFPLHVLTPKRLPNSPWKRDWNLALLALSAGLVNVTLGSYGDVYQYSLYTFKWSSLQLGYFISASGFSAAIFLTAILPAIFGLLKRASATGKLRHIEDARRATVFDFHLLRVSSLIIAGGYALMAFAPTGFIFTLCYMITTFGQGFIPAVQSVATMLYADTSGQDNAGRLLSALSVAYGLGGRLFGPLIFGTVFSNTVSFFPTAIFWTAVGCALAVFLLLSFVRMPNLSSASARDAEQQDTLVLRGDGVVPNSELEPLLGDV